MRNSQNPGSQEFWGRFVKKPRALSHAAAVKLSACQCKSCRQQQEVAYPFFHLERLGTSLHQPPGGFCARSARENADNNLGNGGRRILNVWLDAFQGAEYVCVPEIPAPSWCLPPFNTTSRPFSWFKKPLPGTPPFSLPDKTVEEGGDGVLLLSVLTALLTNSVPSRLPKASPGCGKVGRGQALDLEGSRG